MKLNRDVLDVIISNLDQTDANELRQTSTSNNKVFDTWLSSNYISIRKDIIDDELLKIIKSGMKITKLNLSFCNRITDVGLEYVSILINSGKEPSLTYLDLS